MSNSVQVVSPDGHVLAGTEMYESGGDPYAVDRSCWDEKTGAKSTSAEEYCLSVVVFGASGDLAKKKTFPALGTLFSRKGFVPSSASVIGFARSDFTSETLREKLRPNLTGDDSAKDAFLKRVSYVRGAYDQPEGFEELGRLLAEKEASYSKKPVARLFYLALPPNVYPEVLARIKEHCSHIQKHHFCQKSWVRVIIEKPFGKDLESAEDLSSKINNLFTEEQIYRIDHFLGKELAQNMLVMRFANTFLGAVWNQQQIDNVQIVLKEPFGTEGRGGYFDNYGIIRDVIQNHLLQVLALVAMERPVSMHPDDIRDEKTKVIRAMRVVEKDDVVLGQYVAANGKPGYLDDEGVPADSKTATYAAVRIWIDNDRWEGVPFVIKAGKALNEKKTEVRVQFKSQPGYFSSNADEMRNEFVMRVQPNEAMYMKMVVKKPGLEMEHVMSELNLTYGERYDVEIPEAYERLILDAIKGNQQHYVRRDELRASWAMFTPILHAIDKGEGPPVHHYPYGARGLPEADELAKASGYIRTKEYHWKPDGQTDKSRL